MLPQEVKTVLERLERAGHRAYAVGGCVRDMLRGCAPHDYDMTTSARPEEVLALFAPHAIPTGLQHGTVTVRENHESFEVTTFRADGVYSDHRRPDSVTFSDSLSEDLQRRDFTINAMAMDLRGQVYDDHGGAEDLRRGIIRCVGDGQTRFREDALRILRGLRFAAVLGYGIEEQTAAAMADCAHLLRHIAAERIEEEMSKILCGDHVLPVLLTYPQIFGVFLPELLPCVGFAQQNPHHMFDVWTHTCRAVAAAPPNGVLRWAMLLHDLGKAERFSVDENGVGHFYGHAERSAELSRRITARLRFEKKTAARVELLIAWHDRDISRTARGVRRALRELGEEALRQLLEVKRADNLAQHPDYRWVQQELDRFEELLAEELAKESCFSLQQLAVDGRDLLALGLRGSEIGRTLNALLEQVVEGEVPNEKDALLAVVREKPEDF